MDINKCAEIREALRENMGLTQEIALPAIEWFFYGARGTGRSYVAAVAAVMEALHNPNEWIEVYDHYPMGNNSYSRMLMIEQVRKVISSIPDSQVRGRFSFNTSRPSLIYQEKSLDTE